MALEGKRLGRPAHIVRASAIGSENQGAGILSAGQLGAAIGHFGIALVVGYIIIGLCWIVPAIRRNAPHVAYILGSVFAGLPAFIPVGGPDELGLIATALAIGFFMWRYDALTLRPPKSQWVKWRRT